MPEDCLLTSPLEPPMRPMRLRKSPDSKCANTTRAARSSLPFRDADQPLWSRRQLSCGELPRDSSASPPFSRSKGCRLTFRHHLGNRNALSRVSSRGRPFEACFHLLSLANPPDWVNVGTGSDLTILDLAKLVAKTVGYSGEILTDPSKPDGTPKKLLDISKIKNTGWSPKVPFEDGLHAAYQDFLASLESGAARL